MQIIFTMFSCLLLAPSLMADVLSREYVIEHENNFVLAFNRMLQIVEFPTFNDAKSHLDSTSRQLSHPYPQVVKIESAFYLIKYRAEEQVWKSVKVDRSIFFDEALKNAIFDVEGNIFSDHIFSEFTKAFEANTKLDSDKQKNLLRYIYTQKIVANNYFNNFLINTFLNSYDDKIDAHDAKFRLFLLCSSFEGKSDEIIYLKKPKFNFELFPVLTEQESSFFLQLILGNASPASIENSLNNFVPQLYTSLFAEGASHVLINQHLDLISTKLATTHLQLRFLIALKSVVDTKPQDKNTIDAIRSRISQTLATTWENQPDELLSWIQADEYAQRMVSPFLNEYFRTADLAQIRAYVHHSRAFIWSDVDTRIAERLIETKDSEGMAKISEKIASHDAKDVIASLANLSSLISWLVNARDEKALDPLRALVISMHGRLEYKQLFEEVASEHISDLRAQVLHQKIVSDYESQFGTIHSFRFQPASLPEGTELKQTDPTTPVKVIYNNEAFTHITPTNPEFIKGKPLALNEDTPIGYNIYLPQKGEKIEHIVVNVYGGNSPKNKGGLQYETRLASNGLWPNLLNENIAHIQLNLVDLLSKHHQRATSDVLYKSIQDSIHHFFHILTNDPAQLHEDLPNHLGKNLHVFLRGESYGGGVVARHAQLFPKTFTGYISHDGALSTQKSDYYRSGFLTYAKYYSDFSNFAAKPENVAKLQDRILILHNIDDNRVPAEVSFDFVVEAAKAGKSHLVELFVTKQGNPIVSIASDKGHFFPKNPAAFKRYIDKHIQFIKFPRENMNESSAWKAYQYKKLALTYRFNLSPKQLFTGHAFETMVEHSHDLCNIFDEIIWKRFYEPTQKAAGMVEVFRTNPGLAAQEQKRLIDEDLLNDSNLQRVFDYYRPATREILAHINRPATTEEIDAVMAAQMPALLDVLRKNIISYFNDAGWRNRTLNEPDEEPIDFYKENIAFQLYLKNPDLINGALQKTFQNYDFSTAHEIMKNHFVAVIKKRDKFAERCTFQTEQGGIPSRHD